MHGGFLAGADGEGERQAPVIFGSSAHDGGPGFGHAVSVVRNIMGKDLNPNEDLLVLEIDQKQTVMHNMNRWDLLVHCRGLVAAQHLPAPADSLHTYTSEFFRTPIMLLHRATRLHTVIRGDSGGAGIRVERAADSPHYVITELCSGSAAARSADIMPGDVLMSVDGVPVCTSCTAGVTALMTGAAGSPAVLGIVSAASFRVQDLRSVRLPAKEGKAAEMLNFRDMRCLQGITEPVMHVRKGAIVVSMDPIRAVITSSTIFVVLKDGQDSELQPLTPRLRAAAGQHADGLANSFALPFELRALDAIFYTVFLWHLNRVRECKEQAAQMVSAVQTTLTDAVLFQILARERIMHQELEALAGLIDAIGIPLDDSDMISNMCLSRHTDLPPKDCTAAAAAATDRVMRAEHGAPDDADSAGGRAPPRPPAGACTVSGRGFGGSPGDVGVGMGAVSRSRDSHRGASCDVGSGGEDGGGRATGRGSAEGSDDACGCVGMDGMPPLILDPSPRLRTAVAAGDEARRGPARDASTSFQHALGLGADRQSDADVRAVAAGGGGEEVECEQLLDRYSSVFRGLKQHVHDDLVQLAASKELVRMQLKVRRNALVDVDMHFELATCLVAIVFLIPTIFGQNLQNGLESASDKSLHTALERHTGLGLPFIVVVSASLALGAVSGVCCLCCLRALRSSL